MESMAYRVAVVGATGNVGREMLKILAERQFPVREVAALASERSMGKLVSFGDEDTLPIQNLAKFDFTGWDIALASAGGAISAEFAPRAAKAGCVVIDNSSHFRMDLDVPLIVPEVNPAAIAGYTKKRIIANPNCSTIQLVTALKPLHDIARIKRVVVATYQSVSGAGKEGMDELYNQSRAIFALTEAGTKKFSKRIAFNLIPQIDQFMPDGSTKEEWKMMVETRKILDPNIQMAVTCVRVPVFIGHSEAVHIEFESPITLDQARKALMQADGVALMELEPELQFISPLEAAGDDLVFVSRLRVDPTVPNGLSMWVVADNLRKGAALNAVQIAELLVRDHLSLTSTADD
jgi:aspartate-semialdehyde dehydrogenase